MTVFIYVIHELLRLDTSVISALYDDRNHDLLWEKVKSDFPNDPAFQEVHYARLKIQEHTKNMNDEEYIAYIKKNAKSVLKSAKKVT